ncbi:hypothetical protein M426DRAFT_11231 [Hypoxylon sp. CI-4A]|nr:hypothetical protein M426DRAFT_11231 [Hypoxylon sp. CI-4A]
MDVFQFTHGAPTQPSSFTRFAELPAELRAKIWRFAAPEALPLCFKEQDPKNRETKKCAIPIAGVFHVNREARYEIARHSLFIIHSPSVTMDMTLTDSLQGLCSVIQHVAFCWCPHCRQAELKQLLPLFERLRSVGIVKATGAFTKLEAMIHVGKYDPAELLVREPSESHREYLKPVCLNGIYDIPGAVKVITKRQLYPDEPVTKRNSSTARRAIKEIS